MEAREETPIEAAARQAAALREALQAEALRGVPREKVAEEAAALGLPVHEALAQISEAELRLAYDLAIHAAPPGRVRAIDRLGRRTRPSAAGEAAAPVLRGLQAAWFSVFRVLEAHPACGLVLEDALLGGEAWLVDAALDEHAAPDTILALRAARVRGFAITCGSALALEPRMLDDIRAVLAGLDLPPAMATADPRFARLIYRRAIGPG